MTPAAASPPSAAPHHLPGQRVGVLLPLPLGGTYDYRVPDDTALADGDFVTVPLGARKATGVVWGKGQGSVPEAKMKDVFARLDCPSMPEVCRWFIDWVARYTLSAPGAVLKMAMSVPDALNPPKPVSAYELTPKAEGFRMTKARERVLKVLAEGPPRPVTELALEASTGPGVVRGLADAGAIIPVQLPDRATVLEASPDWQKPGPDLSSDQARAAEKLQEGTERGGFGVVLLEGVPGSGKTEVYFQAVAEALKHGGQVLVLLPEIALSAQWLTRFKERFGAPPGVWHSDLTAAQRRVPVAAAVFQRHQLTGLRAVDQHRLAEHGAGEELRRIGRRDLVVPGDDVPAIAQPHCPVSFLWGWRPMLGGMGAGLVPLRGDGRGLLRAAASPCKPSPTSAPTAAGLPASRHRPA